jgi:hypothetical protein
MKAAEKLTAAFCDILCSNTRLTPDLAVQLCNELCSKAASSEDMESIYHVLMNGIEAMSHLHYNIRHAMMTDLDAKHKSLTQKQPVTSMPIISSMHQAPPRGSVQLPGDNRPMSEFALDVAPFFENSLEIFYKPTENIIVEVTKYYDKLQKHDNIGLRAVSAKRMLNILEQRISFYVYSFNMKDKDWDQKYQSPTEQHISILMVSDNFRNRLHQLNRLSFFPLPFIIDGIMQMPNKGYDDRLQAYFCHNLPPFSYTPTKKAISVLKSILADFCFKDKEIDIVMALSFMLTPACRGLYARPTCRTPAFIIKANRERAGKDYLAGVVGCIYEGKAIDDSPLSTGDGQKNNEELRKKLTSAIKQGRRRYHSSNNKGWLDIAILEQFLTSEEWRDRELGKNHELQLHNEIDFSLSANVGITYPPDLWYRCRPINLFYSEEDPNGRAFSKPDLHGYVIQHRPVILNAIYSLIKDWIDAGQPPGPSLFTSFPEWARVVGGIMHHHGLGDPCQKVEDDGIGGDRDTQDMKSLFELAHKHKVSPVTPSQLMEVLHTKWQEEEGIFSRIDLGGKSGRTIFGLMLQKYTGRTLSGIKLRVDDIKQRSARRKYYFYDPELETPKETDGNLGNLGNVSIPTAIKKIENNIELRPKLTKGCQVANFEPSETLPEATEEYVSPEIINMPCSLCGASLSHFWDKRGKPICGQCRSDLGIIPTD